MGLSSPSQSAPKGALLLFPPCPQQQSNSFPVFPFPQPPPKPAQGEQIWRNPFQPTQKPKTYSYGATLNQVRRAGAGAPEFQTIATWLKHRADRFGNVSEGDHLVAIEATSNDVRLKAMRQQNRAQLVQGPKPPQDIHNALSHIDPTYKGPKSKEATLDRDKAAKTSFWMNDDTPSRPAQTKRANQGDLPAYGPYPDSVNYFAAVRRLRELSPSDQTFQTVSTWLSRRKNSAGEITSGDFDAALKALTYTARLGAMRNENEVARSGAALRRSDPLLAGYYEAGGPVPPKAKSGSTNPLDQELPNQIPASW